MNDQANAGANVHPKFLSGDSDIFIGRRGRLKRYLVCPMAGYFPVLVKTGPNSLAVIYRTGAPHLGITGTVAVSTSADGGMSWSDPIEIQPRWQDVRNPALGVNRKGEPLAAFWKAGLHAYSDRDGAGLRWSGEDQKRSKTIPALYFCKSSDGGRTWSAAKPYMSKLLALASPYGRILDAPDGTLLMAVYGSPRDPIEGVTYDSILLRSKDEGDSWGDETLVAQGCNETSFAFLPEGKMIAAARSDAGGHTAVLFSEDAGRTWSAPKQVTRDGEHPADIAVLQSGKLLLTFGRRITPMGCGLLFSGDGGRTWDFEREVLLAGDSPTGDCGYPSTVQLDDGTIVTVLYYADGSEMAARGESWGKVSCQAIRYREEDVK